MWIEARAALAALLVLGASAGPVRAQDAELVGRRIRAIEIDTDRSLDEHALRRLLPFKVGEPLGAGAFEEAHQILELKDSFREITITGVPAEDEVVVIMALKMKKLVGTVRVYDVHNMSSTEVRRLVRLYPGAIYDPKLVDDASARLKTRYERLGYPNAVIRQSVEPHDDVMDVRFDVDEGEPLLVSRAIITGDFPADVPDVAKELTRLEDKPRAQRTQRDAERKLLRLFREAGYYEVRIKSSWMPTSDLSGSLSFAVQAGPKFDIEITGNEELSRKTLLGQMDLMERLLITDGTWRELARRMVQAYQNEGFNRAEVKVEIERGNPKRVHFTVTEGRKYRIRKLRFVGNEGVSSSELRDQMVTQPARTFPWPRSGFLVNQVLDDDLKRLWFFYREQGYHEAEIVDARPEFNEKKGSIELTIVIEEGQRTMVREIRKVGLDALADRTLALKQRVGAPLNPTDVQDDRRTLISALANEGYPSAKVDSQVETRAGSDETAAVLTWQADAGEREKIGRIIVQGNIETRDRAILRELPFESGDPLDPQALIKGQGNIYKLGLFRLVSVRPIETDSTTPGVRDIGVRVTEGSPGRFEYGGGFNTRDGFVGFGEIGYANLWGMARRISLRGQGTVSPTNIDDHQYLGSLTFTEPRLGESQWTLVTNLVGQRSTQTIDPFKFERFAFTASTFREIWPRTKGEIDLQVERADLFDVKRDVILRPEDQGVLRTIAPSLFFVYDQRDDPFAPRQGSLDSLRVRYALPGLSTLQFVKLTLQHSQYVPVTKDLTFIFAARGGWGRSFEGSPALPIRERFFLGGSTTVRGFKENSIGPTGSLAVPPSSSHLDDPIGGDLAINLNAELDFPLVYGFGGATFIDAGGVYLPNVNTDGVCFGSCATTLDNFRRAAGLGLRYLTPVGPISLDYGIKLDRRHGESFGEVAFSIGAIF